VPGPTPESNEGCFRWGLAWTAFSLFLILIIAIITVGCYFLSRLAG
jgi:flagellar biogenesis protein FliO